MSQTAAAVLTGLLVIGVWCIARPIRLIAWNWFVVKLEGLGSDHYDKTFPFRSVLAPLLWLAIVWACMLTMLYAVGYLSADAEPGALLKYEALLKSNDVDFGSRRAAFGFSGVTLAITLALALTSLFWCVAAAWTKAGAFRITVMAVATGFLWTALTVSDLASQRWTPFTSELGALLLKSGAASSRSGFARDIPVVMFILSSVVPSILLAGATLLLQPMTLGPGEGDLSEQLKVLKSRLRELDQMLYIGALSLVFGTLQLSSGLSVPLVSLPKAPDVKMKADICKTVGPSTAASSVFFADPPAKAHPQARAKQPPLGPAVSPPSDEECRQVPDKLAKLDIADSLRQLVRGVTLCFGLAFSALLAAIYVPSLIVLRKMIEERQDELATIPALGPILPNKPKEEPLVVDPFTRIAAVIATLSPLLAGVVANAVSGN